MGGLVASSPALRPALRWLLPGAASAVHCSLLVLPTHSGQASAVGTQAASVLLLVIYFSRLRSRLRGSVAASRGIGGSEDREEHVPLCRSSAPRLSAVVVVGELRGLRAARKEEENKCSHSNERKVPK